MKKKGLLTLAATLLLGTALAGCGASKTPAPAPAPSQGGGTSTPAPQVKEYIVGTDAAYAPFESENDKKEIVGFDIELLTAVAEKGGFKVKFVNTPWEGIFTSLKNGDRDILISAITITEERKKEMDFSEPYFEAKQLIAVPKDSKIAKFEDLKGKKVGVQTGTTGDDVVSKLLGKDSKDIKRFESTPLALKEMVNGGVEAVVADNGVVINYVKNNSDKGFKTVEDASFEKEFYGIAVKKGNKEVLDKINAGLKKVKEDGTYQKIYDKYFGK
ncbi:basic amino acid ABC transporter substrate-binding protein [Effusibacillus lacus]|uniref:Basic amino acid ABC transporter substrate-binding protein n=1 Tax=Effusibacillus lacus TaxID=1348429 RepID=A0A292YMF5_9BACL|nr:basic amino acid ABC transporter substrate-binding protein [Effusibacillus lacus]TCS67861.1 amino acid ABC transporter substrate-binding protein (PAAT family) [Effusibacillus lacus]GAX89685.1 basic amino acid ABC transporter substrate-binding protein [Effusibacillus lacus]